LFEGLAFEARGTLAPLLVFAGIDRLDGVTLIGGGAKNDLLVQIKASTQDAAMHIVDLEEATALGAAMLAGVGAGIYPDARAAASAIRSKPRTIEPVPADVDRYERLYRDIFEPLFPALRDLNYRIHELAEPPAASN
jgi:xylulokinase